MGSKTVKGPWWVGLRFFDTMSGRKFYITSWPHNRQAAVIVFYEDLQQAGSLMQSTVRSAQVLNVWKSKGRKPETGETTTT